MKRDIGPSLPLGAVVQFVRDGGTIRLGRHPAAPDLIITTAMRNGSNRVESEYCYSDHVLVGAVEDDGQLFYVAQFVAELCGVNPGTMEQYDISEGRVGYTITGPAPERPARPAGLPPHQG